MIEPWQAVFDEYPSGALDFGVMRGEDRSTLEVLSSICADDLERQNSKAEFDQRMVQARQEAAFRNTLDESHAISEFIDASPENPTS
jgi:hypothetical protein